MANGYPEIYVSVDIETTGPTPLKHILLSIGAAAYFEDGERVGTFSHNLLPIPNMPSGFQVWDSDTEQFWKARPEALHATQIDRIPAQSALRAFSDFLRNLPGLPVFTAYPAGFDFSWIFTVAGFFDIELGLNWSALDIKTLAMAAGNTGYRDAVKAGWKKSWKTKGRHTHIALDDAIEQGESFIKILRDVRELHEIRAKYVGLK